MCALWFTGSSFAAHGIAGLLGKDTIAIFGFISGAVL